MAGCSSRSSASEPLPGEHPSLAALRGALDGMSAEARGELCALAWVGRGSYARGDWEQARLDAANAPGAGTAEALLEMADLDVLLMKGLYEPNLT